MKKVVYSLLLICSLFIVTGCGAKEEQITGNLSDLMKQVYVDIPEEELPKLAETKVTKENEQYYLGTTELNYEEALASEPMMTSIAHSVVLIRMKDGEDIAKAKEQILDKVDPRKWVCVEVEKKNVIVESRGNLIILIMDNQYASKLQENFQKLESVQS